MKREAPAGTRRRRAGALSEGNGGGPEASTLVAVVMAPYAWCLRNDKLHIMPSALSAAWLGMRSAPPSCTCGASCTRQRGAAARWPAATAQRGSAAATHHSACTFGTPPPAWRASRVAKVCGSRGSAMASYLRSYIESEWRAGAGGRRGAAGALLAHRGARSGPQARLTPLCRALGRLQASPTCRWSCSASSCSCGSSTSGRTSCRRRWTPTCSTSSRRQQKSRVGC